MNNYFQKKSLTTHSNQFNANHLGFIKPNYRIAMLSFAVISGLTVMTACNQTKIDKEIELEPSTDILAEMQEKQAKTEILVTYQAEMLMQQNMQSKQLSVAVMSPRSSIIRVQPKPITSIGLPVINIDQNDESYLKSLQNPVKQVSLDPVSTFSVDVDTGSYGNSRRILNKGQLPVSDAVREEAFINYFNYDYSGPINTDIPFAVHSEVANAPWNEQRQLIKIGIKGFEIEKADLKAANLVFLLDVSGSMNASDKLPLLKSSLTLLTKQLDENDSVAIVVYAGAAGVVLPATAGNDHFAITNALNQLSAGGSTNGAQGIELAYQIAQKNFKKGGVNRVILATDGDFNVGTQSIDKLKQLIAKKRDTGIALTTLGFGQGNYNDGLMEQLANIGNGQYAYIDTINEARKVLVDELSSSMQIIAKDVKVQIEFNPQQVAEYRLIGYQNRLLANEDFNNDKVDAAELGAGHTVTALYEITLVDAKNKQVDDLRYQVTNIKEKQITTLNNQELAFVKIRYKQLNNDTSEMISQAVFKPKINTQNSSDFKFSAAVAGFAQLLKGAKYTGQWQYQDCVNLALENKGKDPFGYRTEFIQLVRTAAALQ